MTTDSITSTLTAAGVDLTADFRSGQEIRFRGATTRNGVDYELDFRLTTRDLALAERLCSAASSVNPLLPIDYYREQSARHQTEAWVCPGDEFFNRYSVRRTGSYADATDATYTWFRETLIPAVARWAGEGHEELKQAERQHQAALHANAETTAVRLENLAAKVREHGSGVITETDRRWINSVEFGADERLIRKLAEIEVPA